MNSLVESLEIRDVPEVGQPTQVKPPPIARPLSALACPARDDPSELLRSRFLCRGGGLLLCGPTGIGKSALAMQFAILWAIGRDCFGIAPARLLKSLLIQAENDEGDLAEMRDGIMRGFALTSEQAKQACDAVIVAQEDTRTSTTFFLEVVAPLVAEHKPDLLLIDPALAYLGGETSSQADVGRFLRNGLNPLLHEFKCGCVVVHHTNKPATGREKANWLAGDFAYLGSGSAEWANWARAVLALRSIGSHEVFELRAAKRGGRLGWKEADGRTKAFTKYLAHAREPGIICWRDAEADEKPSAKLADKPPAKFDLLALIPPDGSIDKHALESKAGSAGIAEKRTRGLLAELMESGLAFEWKIRRKAVRPSISIARRPQPEPSDGLLAAS